MPAFDVDVPTLLAGAVGLRGDGDDVGAAGGHAARAAADAGAVCGGPLLQAALGRLDGALRTWTATTGGAVSAAGDTLDANAARYTTDDDQAAAALDATFTATAW